jgi:hypothetical protein
MFFVTIHTVFGIDDVPSVAEGLTSLIQLNKLLKFKVCASKSILHPVDCNSLNNQTSQEEACDSQIRFLSVESKVEKTKSQIVNEVFSLFVIFKAFDLLQEWGWVLNKLSQDQDDELHSPNSSSKFNKDGERLRLVLLGNHLGHFEINLCLNSTDLSESLCSLTDSVSNSDEEIT